MLKTLVRIRLAQKLSSMLGKTRKKSGPSRMILYGILMLYVAVVVVFMFVGIFSMIAKPFYEAGLGWLYFSFAALIDLALMFFLGMFAAKAQLYEANDNELLLSMPIPPRTILVSRMLSVLADSYLTGLLVAAPAGIVWLINCPADAGMIGCFLILFLALPLLAFALSGVVGFALAKLTAKVRNKTMVTTVLSLAFMGVYFYFYSKMNTYLQSLAVSGETLAAALGGFGPLVWAGRACAEGDFASLLGCVLIIAAAFALVYGVLSATFAKIVTSSGGTAKVQYRRRAVKQSSVSGALLRKELQRLVSSSNYLLNGALGAVFCIVLPILLLVKKQQLLEALSLPVLTGGLLAGVVCGLICLVLGTGSISAPALSLEGKSLWIPQSMPVRGRDVLLAKARCQLAIMLPAGVLAGVLAAVAVAPDAITGLAMVLVAAAFAVFAALTGLWQGIRHPMFDWVSEVQVVKQSTAALLTMLICWAAALSGGAGMAYLATVCHPAVGMAVFMLILAAADVAMLRGITRKGDKILAELV